MYHLMGLAAEGLECLLDTVGTGECLRGMSGLVQYATYVLHFGLSARQIRPSRGRPSARSCLVALKSHLVEVDIVVETAEEHRIDRSGRLVRGECTRGRHTHHII